MSATKIVFIDAGKNTSKLRDIAQGISDLLEEDGATVLPGNRDALQVLHATGAAEMANQVLTAVHVDETAASKVREAFDHAGAGGLVIALEQCLHHGTVAHVHLEQFIAHTAAQLRHARKRLELKSVKKYFARE